MNPSTPRSLRSTLRSEAGYTLFEIMLVLGIIARVAPQVGIFSVGFPMTLGVGLVGIAFTLPLLQTPFVVALEHMLAFFR